MHPAEVPEVVSLDRILEPIRRYWGFDQLRALQEKAIRAALEHRDSVVVLPTGGGKSLCYQVPPIVAERIDVVVSPLISLMKDQVDGLRACGYPAAAIHSGLTPDERNEATRGIRGGKYHLVFVSPERILTPGFLGIIQRLDVRAFAIDEAHCISHWGHDFRPEYRQLSALKERFPRASVHAYTATATQRVRHDIAEQLGLHEPAMLVGNFDRQNLVYRVVPRLDVYAQAVQVVRRHTEEAVIIYCLSRNDTEAMAEVLRHSGIEARPYHAGMNAAERRATQDAFAKETLNVVTATVAFGMGIDRSNVRCIIHATMPKSIEHYQQETGRAGRDGLEAECVLFYSAGDEMRWESLLRKSAEEAERPPEALDAQLELLAQMRRFCAQARCRHRALSEYFGQAYDKASCGACDVCLQELEGLADSTVTAQKILSCVARVQERFGLQHVVEVLLGRNTERIRRFQHDRLSTYALMKDIEEKTLKNLVHQLLDQGLLDRSDDEYRVLKLNTASWEVMRGTRSVHLVEPKSARAKRTRVDVESWEGVNRGLFESLRNLRKQISTERGVPPFVVFSDAALRDLARRRPTSETSLRAVYGLGEKKIADLGQRFLERIRSYCRQHGIAADVTAGTGARESKRSVANPAKRQAFAMFSKGRSIDDVATAIGRARRTTVQYLAEFIEMNRPERIDAWVSPATCCMVADAVNEVGPRYLRPIFDQLEGTVSYDEIRLVVAHLASRERDAS